MLYPLRFNPIFKPRIWGGRRLEELFGKRLPAGQSIGESWELSGLRGDESVVAAGPLAGQRLTDLVERFGADLLGRARLLDGRFPLLVKLLDARQNLSVQVHPGPRMVQRLGPGVRLKSECWYVIDAAAGAQIWVGLKAGVDRDQFAAAVSTGTAGDLLCGLPARAGDFFYLPAGTVHALGAGIVVAEVQTPSDTTYRVYDWNRIDAATGQPRQLHVAEALEAMDYAPPPAQPKHDGAARDVTRLLACEHFVIDKRTVPAGQTQPAGQSGRMVVWQVVAGKGRFDFSAAGASADLVAGELVVLPASMPPARVTSEQSLEVLEITIPE
ncbi:MAG: class I mannose-6-phosphate isomerase [Phycisphaerae bacterium]|nr:class I mannose-6-phosphate isomerase [Phycisphaerae bacterium]